MAKATDKISIVQSYELPKPCAESGVFVPMSEWNQLITRAKETEDQSRLLDSIGWSAVSAAVTAFFTAIAFAYTTPLETAGDSGGNTIAWGAVWLVIGMWAVAIGGLVGGIAALYFAHSARKRNIKDRNWLADDMQLYADRYRPTA